MICLLVLDVLMIKMLIHGILSFHRVRSTPVLSVGTPVSQGFTQADSKSKTFQKYNTIQLEGKFVIHLVQSPAQSSDNF